MSSLNPLDKEPIEIGDGRFDHVDQLRCEWKDRFTIDQPRFVQRYTELKLHIVVRFTSCAIAEDYAALFHSAGISARNPNASGFGGVAPGDCGSLNREKYAALSYKGRKDEAVFIENVELVELPKRLVPSFVWLLPYDRLFNNISRALYLVWNDLSYKRLGVCCEREARPIVDVLRSMIGNEVTSENVERRPQVMDEVSENERDLDGNLWPRIEPGAPPPFRIRLHNNGVGVLPTDEGRKLGAEVVQVLLGPLDLSSRAGRWIGHD